MTRWGKTATRSLGLVALALAILVAAAFAQDDGNGSGDGDGSGDGTEGEEAVVEATETITLASPEEYRTYLEAERATIAREREALLVLRAEVKKDIERLTTLQAQMDQRKSQIDEERDSKVKKLIKIYSSMDPEEVKPLIAKLDEDLMLRVLYGMKPKDQAAILALYAPEEAARISEMIMKKSF